MYFLKVLELFFKLLIGHALADFALQNEFMALSKNRNTPPNYLDKVHLPMWPYTLTCHALINAGVVWVIIGNPIFAIIELVSHWLIDFVKCEGIFTIHEDQCFHVFIKFIIAFFYYYGVFIKFL